MSIVLNFNGTVYTVPSDIMEYLKILDTTENVQETLIADFAEKSADRYDGIVELRTMQPSFSKAAEKYVHLLCEKGIYDQTVEDFIAESDGYELFSEIGEKASQTHERFSREERQNIQRRSQAAVRRALSQINGSGVSVYSSSFLTLAMSSAVEYSTLKKQYNKANEQYKQSLSYYRFDEENERKRKERNYHNTYYQPQVEKALQMYSYELMQKYLIILVKNKQFDKSSLEFVDIGRSNKLLSNLKLSSDKEKVLEMAFLACPFNINTYLELGKMGCLDKKTLESARRFDLVPSLKEEFDNILSKVKYTGDICKDLQDVEGVISALSLITSNKKEYYYKKFAQPIYDNVVQRYTNLQRISSDKDFGLQILKKYIANVANLSDEIILGFSQREVLAIITEREFHALIVKCGFSDLTDRIKWESNAIEKSKIDDFYIKSIYQAWTDLSRVLTERAAEQEKKKQENLKAIHHKKLIAKILYAALVVVPIVLVILTTRIWKGKTKCTLETHIKDNLYMACREKENIWNKIGGISDVEIGDLRVYKEGYVYTYVEAEIKYYTGFSNIAEEDVTQIVENVYDDVEISLPWCFAMGSMWGDFAPWPGEVVAQSPNGKVITVDTMNSYIQNYNHSKGGKVVYASTPISIIYFLLLGIGFFVLRLYLNNLEKRR